MLAFPYLVYYSIFVYIVRNYIGDYPASIFAICSILLMHTALCELNDKSFLFRTYPFHTWRERLGSKRFYLVRFTQGFLLYQFIQTILFVFAMKYLDSTLIDQALGNKSLMTVYSGLGVSGVLYVVFFAPIFEETLFRQIGFKEVLENEELNSELNRIFILVFAWTMSIGLFVIMHMGTLSVVSAFFMGLLNSVQMLRNKWDLLDCIMVHFSFNLCMLLPVAWFAFFYH